MTIGWSRGGQPPESPRIPQEASRTPLGRPPDAPRSFPDPPGRPKTFSEASGPITFFGKLDEIELVEKMSKKICSLFLTRGVPGTHDINMMLNFFNKGTRPKKYVFGEWVLVIFKLLVILRPLRDTKFDLFGLSKERRLEKKIIGLYEKDLGFIFQNFCSEKRNILIDLAKNPSNIKGFGFIKEKAMDEVLNNRLSLLSKYQ